MDMEIWAREGDLLETQEGLIFDVKGLRHLPNRIIAYLRYYPDPSGNRVREGIRYLKIYSLEERNEFLKKYYPEYLFHDNISGEILQGILMDKIKKIYRPVELVRELLHINGNPRFEQYSVVIQRSFELVKLLVSISKIGFDKIGITGSCLVNLEIESSDIDLIIYGLKNSLLIRGALISLFQQFPTIIQPYSEDTIQELYNFRGKESNLLFNEFVKIEQRKKLQGKFKGLDYYIRCIKDWNELIDEEIHYEPVGTGCIRGKIIDDSEAILTPCKYLIDEVIVIKGSEFAEDIRELVSFRGRFCEQAVNGEEFEAQGKVERVITSQIRYFRLLIGSNKNDYFRVLNLI